jgi:hypothetical protein
VVRRDSIRTIGRRTFSHATEPQETVKAHPGNHVPEDELLAWRQDRAGCMVDARLARKYRWKLGDRIVITIFPVDLELTVSAI